MGHWTLRCYGSVHEEYCGTRLGSLSFSLCPDFSHLSGCCSTAQMQYMVKGYSRALNSGETKAHRQSGLNQVKGKQKAFSSEDEGFLFLVTLVVKP